jgi:dienelactone hydrolase
MTAELASWRKAPFTGAGLTYDCFEKGEGPGVVPGYELRVIARLCVSKEFRCFAANAERPITKFLRAVATDLAARTPGRGVGVIGMCFSGGFALATAVEDVVKAPVLSQPSTPFAVTPKLRRDPGLSAAELAAVKERTKTDGLCVLGLRFSHDRMSPAERFVTLRAELGDAFEVIELDSGPHNAGGYGRTAHSVLTRELRENPANSAYDARIRTVEFLRTHLTATG